MTPLRPTVKHSSSGDSFRVSIQAPGDRRAACGLPPASHPGKRGFGGGRGAGAAGSFRERDAAGNAEKSHRPAHRAHLLGVARRAVARRETARSAAPRPEALARARLLSGCGGPREGQAGLAGRRQRSLRTGPVLADDRRPALRPSRRALDRRLGGHGRVHQPSGRLDALVQLPLPGDGVRRRPARRVAGIRGRSPGCVPAFLPRDGVAAEHDGPRQQLGQLGAGPGACLCPVPGRRQVARPRRATVEGVARPPDRRPRALASRSPSRRRHPRHLVLAFLALSADDRGRDFASGGTGRVRLAISGRSHASPGVRAAGGLDPPSGVIPVLAGRGGSATRREILQLLRDPPCPLAERGCRGPAARGPARDGPPQCPRADLHARRPSQRRPGFRRDAGWIESMGRETRPASGGRFIGYRVPVRISKASF
jgi:hypothetical protein